jgi:hypothetical protein
MITYECIAKDCANKGVKYNFFGSDETAECGGCQTILTGTDLRDDPEFPEFVYPIQPKTK